LVTSRSKRRAIIVHALTSNSYLTPAEPWNVLFEHRKQGRHASAVAGTGS
jgi:hypothetical protein